MSAYTPITKILPKLLLEPGVAKWATDNGICYLVTDTSVSLKGPTGDKSINVSPLGMTLLESGQLGAFSLEELQKSFSSALSQMMGAGLEGLIETTVDAKQAAEAKPFSFEGIPHKTATLKKASKKKKTAKAKSTVASHAAELAAEAKANAPKHVNLEGVFSTGDTVKMEEALTDLAAKAKGKSKLKPTADNPDWKDGAPKVIPPVGAPAAFNADILTKAKVSLISATKMYQPVQGTSTSSVYFCVAADQDLRFGIRIHGHTLSMRVEGNLDKRKADLAAAGIPVKGDYASEHVKFNTEVDVKRILGAAVLSLNLDTDWPMPKTEYLMQKGA